MPRSVIHSFPLSLLVPLITTTTSFAQIEPYSENPCYWQFDGQPTLLIGGSGDDSLFQWAGEPFGDRLPDHLDLLVRVGGNYVRNVMSSRYDAVHGYNDEHMAYPFARLSSGKYDLDRWNNDYWNRLKTFLEETRRRRIVVQLELWDRDAIIGKVPWSRQPWNPANNVTYSHEESSFRAGQHGRRLAFFDAVRDSGGNPIVKNYQDRYIRKMLDITLRFDHVLY